MRCFFDIFRWTPPTTIFARGLLYIVVCVTWRSCFMRQLLVSKAHKKYFFIRSFFPWGRRPIWSISTITFYDNVLLCKVYTGRLSCTATYITISFSFGQWKMLSAAITVYQLCNNVRNVGMIRRYVRKTITHKSTSCCFWYGLGYTSRTHQHK